MRSYGYILYKYKQTVRIIYTDLSPVYLFSMNDYNHTEIIWIIIEQCFWPHSSPVITNLQYYLNKVLTIIYYEID